MIPIAFVLASVAAMAVLVRRVRPLPVHDGPIADRWPDTAVVIPARNEADALPHLLADLGRQTLQPSEVVVVDDDSVDATSQAATAAGARVVPAGERPDGWNPKVWALTVGVRATTAPTVVFLDADVRLSERALADVVADLEHRGGLVSVAPFHQAGSAVESASALCNLLLVAGGGPGVGRHARGAVGSCIAVRRTDYEASGGHAASPATIVDDLALARRFRRLPLPTTLRRGGDAVRVRSYPDGLRSLARGWTKNLAAGMTYTHPVVGLVVAAWLAATLLPAWLLATGDVGPAAATYAPVALATWWLARSVGRFQPLVVSVGAPLLALFVTVLTGLSLARAALGRPTVWKGRPLLASGLERTP